MKFFIFIFLSSFCYSIDNLVPIYMSDGLIIFVPYNPSSIPSFYDYGIFPSPSELGLSIEDYYILISELGIFSGFLFWRSLFGGFSNV